MEGKDHRAIKVDSPKSKVHNVKLLALTRYGYQMASSRLRTFQYIPYLESNQIEITIKPLFDEGVIEGFYNRGRKSVIEVLLSVVGRLAEFRLIRHFDAVWIEKEIIPYFPCIIEPILKRLRIPVIVDYDDAVFHNYDHHRSRFVRTFLGKKVAGVMRSADLVISGNPYISEYARHSGAQRIEFVPTSVDLTKYNIKNARQEGGFRIAWIGTPYTSKYLNIVREALSMFCNDKTTKMTLIGARTWKIADVNIEILPWSVKTEGTMLRECDIGIMPIPDEPFERGKCGYKLIQYMACGLPVVASPVGFNRILVSNGNNGFLANTTQEWITALRTLKENPSLRFGMGQNGRRLVEEEYSLQRNGPRLAKIIAELVKSRTTSQNG